MQSKKSQDIEYEIDLYGALPFIYQSINKIIDAGNIPGDIKIFLPARVMSLNVKVELYAKKKSTQGKNQRIP
jgi:hypothetical protein